MSEIEVSTLVTFQSGTNLHQLAGEWFRLDVANGDARPDTLDTYLNHLALWAEWCRDRGINPAHATQEDVKAYRQFLVTCEAKASTISLKLTTMRRFYQAAVDRKLIENNPVAGIRAPRDREAKEKILYLSAGEAELLIRAVPKDGTLKSLRDRVLIALMAIEGLRRVEIMRGSVQDIETIPNGGRRILIHGKGKKGYIYPREDTLSALDEYRTTRGSVDPDHQGEPLFISVGKGGKPGGRLSRIGVNHIVDTYLVKAGLKRPGISCHALRHTCGHLLYLATRDPKVVQETLRHSNITTAGQYSHAEERSKTRHTQSIPVKME
jgi:integrase/recombinase XerC/integrase/recombinase XerD